MKTVIVYILIRFILSADGMEMQELRQYESKEQCEHVSKMLRLENKIKTSCIEKEISEVNK